MRHTCVSRPWFRGNSGHSAVETALMLPWLIFSFMGTLDFGFATYALISVENAARVAAIYASSNSIIAQATVASPGSGLACTYVLAEMRNAPNVGRNRQPVTTCWPSDPVQVAAAYNPTAYNIPGTPLFLDTATVSVTYTLRLLAIPAIMPSQITITRRVEYPIRG